MKKMNFIAMAILLMMSNATRANQPWKVSLFNDELNLKLNIDLYEESVSVPGMDMFGPMNGYLGGSLANTWMVTSFKIQDDKNATLRLSNDLGSETQECNLIWQNDSICEMNLKGSTVLKKVVNKKYQKLPSTILFEKRKERQKKQ